MSQSLVVAIIYSTGKNGGVLAAGAGIDEAANLNGDPVFVHHSPTNSSFFLWTGSGWRTTGEAGLRVNVGTSIDKMR